MTHEFRLRLPNGLEVQIAGDRDFVVGAYGDIKAGALRLFEREASSAAPPPLSPPALPAAPVLPPPAAATPEVEPAAPARVKRPREPKAEKSAGASRAWSPEQRAKFMATAAAKRAAADSSGGGNAGLDEPRRRSRSDGGTATLNPNVIGGGARLPQPSERATPRRIAAGLED